TAGHWLCWKVAGCGIGNGSVKTYSSLAPSSVWRVGMRRRELLAVLGGAVAWPLTARAQQSPSTVRVAMVCGSRCDGPSVDAFWATLRDLGWADGQNLVRDMRGAGGEPERLPSILAEI